MQYGPVALPRQAVVTPNPLGDRTLTIQRVDGDDGAFSDITRSSADTAVI